MYHEQHSEFLTPHPHDVLCGRGAFSNTHEGNRNWRRLVNANKELYVALPKFQKQLLSQSIVSAVTSQNPPGRFLQREPLTQLWRNVGEIKAIEKTSQALREGGILAREEELQERGITPDSLNLSNPLMSATQLTMSGDAPSAINIYMPSVKDAHKIVPKGAAVEEPANIQATSMYNSQQQSYGSLQNELYGHQQQEQQQPPYDQYGQAPPPMHPHQYNHHPPYPQGPPPTSMPYPPLPRGIEPYYAPVPSNTGRPPCGGGAVSEVRATEIIAAAIAASQAADSVTSTPPATGNIPAQIYPPAVSNNTTQEVESVSTHESGSKVSNDGGSNNKKLQSSTKRSNPAVASSSPNANKRNDNDAPTSPAADSPPRPDPLAKPATSLGSISAMSVSAIMPTIQTSFGDMTLEEYSMKKAALPNKIDTSAPTLTHHERSKGDLLEDSDSNDDDDDGTSNTNTADWDKKMHAAFGITEKDFRPVGNVTGMDLTRDISEMSREISGMSMGDFSLEPSSSSTYMMRDTTVGSIGSRKKDDYEMSEEEKLEKMLLGRGKSLVNEDFGTKEQK